MSDKDKQIVLKNQQSEVTKRIPKRKKLTLEEEEFTDVIKKIIRRDYFPDNLKLEAQLAYIEASESNDPVKLREISERYSTDLNQTPFIQTPLPHQSSFNNSSRADEERSSVLNQPSSKHEAETKSLDTFLSKYHSEDDASFAEIIEREEVQRQEKYNWMYERERLGGNMTRPAITSGKEEEVKRLEEGSSGSTLAITDKNHGEIQMWKYTSKNSLMYVPDGVEYSPAELARRGKAREIKHGNTRLSRDFLKKMASANTPTDGEEIMNREKQLQKEKIGIDGKQIGASESPKIHGYGFVATPQINPGVDASPLMTWGTIEGTPLHIDTDVTSTPGKVFKIPKESIRDNIGLKLASKASKSQREKKKAAMAQATSTLVKSPYIRSPLVGSTSDKLRMLSPAARRLIRHNATPGTLKGDRSLRASYSTPLRSPAISTPTRTPKSYGQGGNTPSLTDNLLKLK